MANNPVEYIVRGLSEAEAARRFREDGPNELPSQGHRTSTDILWDVLKEPMFLLLLACGAIYLISGEVSEAVLLLGFVCIVIGITFFQERKTERALEALRDLSSPRALVLRDAVKHRIAGREVVRGDVVFLSEGDRVPADVALVSVNHLSVDESLLTGESAPVRKTETDVLPEAAGRPGGDDLPFAFSGTLVVSGQGIGVVLGAGFHTEIGAIGRALQTVETGATPLQKETGAIVKKVAVFGLVLCAVVAVIYGATRGNWLDGFLAGLSLAMAMLPEEFPVVLTIFLALGAWRISRHNVLTRRIPAVEALGAATVLCVDKTGTLTMNRMTVSELCADGVFFEVSDGAPVLPEKFHEVVEYCLLASLADPFDPMEKAMRDLGEKTLVHTEHLHRNWSFQKEYPLTKELLAMSRVWRSTGSHDYIIAAKGAPEAIADLCHLDRKQQTAFDRDVAALAGRGHRVIAVARTRFTSTELPGAQHDFNFVFLGLLGLEDPVRPGVKDAIAQCYAAGIRPIMITGDYPGTAGHIAREIGLHNPGECITGPELAKLDDRTLAERIRSVNVFARTVPEQKLRLVQALRNNGEVTAMTGDGVNDAPALKAAHIGIAMGGRGTDVAREASSLVLLDDAFESIVAAVRMGRRIYDNIRKALMFIISIHLPIAGLALASVVFKWPLILLPIHIVFLELVIDPVCSVVFEAEPERLALMERPPRRLQEGLFSSGALWLCVLQGVLVLGLTLLLYVSIRLTHTEDAARSIAFLTLVICGLGLMLTNRSLDASIIATLRSPNRAMWWISGITLALLAAVMVTPPLRALFHFAPVAPDDALLAVLAAAAVIGGMELVKLRTFAQKGIRKVFTEYRGLRGR